MSTNQNEPSHVYFLEDALELWLAVVQNSTTLTPELLGLTVNLMPIIGKLGGGNSDFLVESLIFITK